MALNSFMLAGMMTPPSSLGEGRGSLDERQKYGRSGILTGHARGNTKREMSIYVLKTT